MKKIVELFEKLDEWRFLPSYQLERRSDIFFALYLDVIFKELENEIIIEIIPEFPIRKGVLFPELTENKKKWII